MYYSFGKAKTNTSVDTGRVLLQSAAGFLVMAVLAQCLPVILIPEQILVSPVRNDVVHHRRSGQPAFLLALDAQWMPSQVCCPRLAPFAVIPAKSGPTAQTVRTPFYVLRTVHLALFAETHTSGIAARSSRFHRHAAHLISFGIQNKPVHRRGRARYSSALF